MKFINLPSDFSRGRKFIIIKFFVFLFIFALVLPSVLFAQSEAPVIEQDQFFKGRVLEITGEESIDEFGQILTHQNLRAQIKSGEEKGKEVNIINEFDPNQSSRRLESGDYIVMGKSIIGDDISYYVSDVYRLRALWFILLFFVVLTIVFARKQGVRAFVGLLLSFLVIIYFLIPNILSGANPFFVATISSVLIACTALFIAHGFNVRTLIAFVSTIVTIGIAMALSQIFVYSSRLSGLGTEDAFYLQFSGDVVINLQGLLLAGIIIGTLGVLDDITTAQAAAVDEISKANNKLGFGQLYARGLSVGREHIVSLVNTLVLAYTGAALPLLLLFSIYEQPLWVTLNSEIILEEVMRMIIGSSALVIAVPLTTLLAAWVFGGGGKKFVPRWFWRNSGSAQTHYH